MFFSMVLLLGISSFAVPQQNRSDIDVPAEMQRAEQALQTAKTELNSAGHEWGGHRYLAIKHVDEAIAEVEKGKAWAKQHKEIK